MPEMSLGDDRPYYRDRTYQGWPLSASDHIRAVSSFKSTDDVAASEEADLMLDQSEYAAIEIYEGWRLI